MSDLKILIIGFGVVGGNVRCSLAGCNVTIHDPDKGYKADGKYDVCFVCVPTEKHHDGSCDTKIVEQVVREWSGRVSMFCIRSTVPPGTTEQLNKIAPCVFQPEYYGATQHANAPDYDFAILGGEIEYTNVIAELYKEVYTADFRIIKTNSRTAELTKYMENAWLATKVTFCNEFYRIAKMMGIDYDTLRECWLEDPRINRSHTFVYRNHPWYKSHCLDKDIPAIIQAAEKHGYNAKLLKAVDETNEDYKRG